jgi:hypothetical protein
VDRSHFNFAVVHVFIRRLEGKTVYDIYLDAGLGQYLIDVWDFGPGEFLP